MNNKKTILICILVILLGGTVLALGCVFRRHIVVGMARSMDSIFGSRVGNQAHGAGEEIHGNALIHKESNSLEGGVRCQDMGRLEKL